MAYDPIKGEMFISIYNSPIQGSPVYEVISDSNNSIITYAYLKYGHSSLVYDSGKGEVFVTNTWVASSGTPIYGVSIISDSNNTIFANIPLKYPAAEARAYPMAPWCPLYRIKIIR
jgi:hypothetical protein